MSPNSDRFYIITGGPGSGKTTLINALCARGYSTTLEAGRGIIQSQVAIQGHALPWRDPILFAELMLSWEMRSYHMAEAHDGLVFFDRGVPDVLGYLRLMQIPAPDHVRNAARMFHYNRTVFITPPWQDIFQPDVERKQDFAEAERTYDALFSTYKELNYQLLEIPRSTVEDRVNFVAARLQLRP